MSGTIVKTLDLSLVQAPFFRRLFLLRCEELRAILWPQDPKNSYPYILHISTVTQAISAGEEKSSKDYGGDDTSVGSRSLSALYGGQVPTDFDKYIFVRDTRLLRSLKPITYWPPTHIEISSVANTVAAGFGAIHGGKSGAEPQMLTISLPQLAGKLYMDNIVVAFIDDHLQADGANKGVSDGCNASVVRWMCPCPPIPQRIRNICRCYINIQDEMHTTFRQGHTKETSTMVTLPDFMSDAAMSLHVHDSLSITTIPGPKPAVGLTWAFLYWCRIERCPNLEDVIFTAPLSSNSDYPIFYWLHTFWASQHLKARYIWDWSRKSSFRPADGSFKGLELLPLDYCLRLIHVLPLYKSNGHAWHRLETLEIVCCGDLREVFPLDSDLEQKPIEFLRLRRIHLQELPMLHHICGSRMFTPNLETVKIRGCWGLRRLPAVHRSGSPPKVDCEKDWWDGLEWDGMEANHHPSLYKPKHSLYYKKAMPRVSVLR